jgi:hypothetical protein
MESRQGQIVVLGATEVLRIWLESATTLLVASGRVVLRGPPDWLAETMVMPERHLATEGILLVPRAGWFELAASAGAQVVLIEPARKSWRHWLKRRAGQVAC